MHILNVIQCSNLGGMERASLRLMHGLQSRGHSFDLLSLHPLGDLKPLLDEAGIAHGGLQHRGRGGWRDVLTLRRKLQNSRCDALLMTGTHLLGMLALRDLCPERRILAVHFHHTGVRPAWQWRMLYQLVCQRFQAVTFPSDFIRKEAEALHPPVAGIAHTVRNPLPIPPLPGPAQRLAARHKLGLPADAYVIGNAGWLIPRKRFDVFLETARQLAARFNRAVFVIAGDGELQQQLKIQAECLGLSGRVRWLGWQRNMQPFYDSLDVLLFNSDWDAFPTTPLEAMSHGVPVVASLLHGGLSEALAPGSRWLLDRHDVAALAELVGELLTDTRHAREVGRIQRLRVAELSSVDEIAARHEALFLGRRHALSA